MGVRVLETATAVWSRHSPAATLLRDAGDVLRERHRPAVRAERHAGGVAGAVEGLDPEPSGPVARQQGLAAALQDPGEGRLPGGGPDQAPGGVGEPDLAVQVGPLQGQPHRALGLRGVPLQEGALGGVGSQPAHGEVDRHHADPLAVGAAQGGDQVVERVPRVGVVEPLDARDPAGAAGLGVEEGGRHELEAAPVLGDRELGLHLLDRVRRSEQVAAGLLVADDGDGHQLAVEHHADARDLEADHLDDGLRHEVEGLA